MPSEEDILFGKIAIEKGYVTREQVDEALQNQNKMVEMGLDQPLGEVMVSKDYFSRDILRELTRELQRRSGRHRTIGPYEPVAKLGEGGMGAVYKAKFRATGAIVAMKILSKRLAADRDFVARFRREAEIASRLNHPNIVRAIAAGEDAGYHYFIMEYVEGENVGTWLRRSGVIPEGQALEIVRDVAFALAHAHEAGLVHRDVKPDNIFLAPHGGVKLGDMGLAKATDEDVTRITQAGMMVGTPYYVSPEQASGERNLDTRTDIYSLGATLYHLVTGEVPFAGATALEIVNKHLHEELPWPAEVNDDLTDDICYLIEKMMAKAPRDRYQEPLELIHDIDLVIRGMSPDSAVLAIGKSSIRKAVSVRQEPEAAERRQRRLEADAERSLHHRARVGVGLPGARETNWALVGVGIGAGVVMLIIAVVLLLTPSAPVTDKTRIPKRRKPRPPVEAPTVDPYGRTRRHGAERLLATAKKLAASQPVDRDGLMRRYEHLAGEYSDLPEGKEAAERLAAMRKERPPATRLDFTRPHFLDREDNVLSPAQLACKRGEEWLVDPRGEPPKPVLGVPRAARAPVLDGALDDACWGSAAVARDFVESEIKVPAGEDNPPAPEKTEMRLCYDESNLYVAVTAFDGDIPGLVRKGTATRKQLWADDGVELFLDCERGYRTYRQVMINVDGAHSEGTGRGSVPDTPGLEARTRIYGDRWTMEIVVPLAGVGGAGTRKGIAWGANLVRNSYVEGEYCPSSWAHLKAGTHHAPLEFGYLVFGAQASARAAPAPPGYAMPAKPIYMADFEKGAGGWTPVKIVPGGLGDSRQCARAPGEKAQHWDVNFTITPRTVVRLACYIPAEGGAESFHLLSWCNADRDNYRVAFGGLEKAKWHVVHVRANDWFRWSDKKKPLGQKMRSLTVSPLAGGHVIFDDVVIYEE